VLSLESTVATKNQTVKQMSAAGVERTTVKGREVWHVRSAESGRFLQVITKASSKRSMDKAAVLYGRALKRLADR
jgi:hypothetical protein